MYKLVALWSAPKTEDADAFEKAYFEFHLARENGSMTRVAERTGLERTHLYRKLKQLGVDLSRNKRSGAFLFVDFLARNGRLIDANDQPVINDIGLAALALLVAESDPTQKDTLIRLIMNLLAQQN